MNIYHKNFIVVFTLLAFWQLIVTIFDIPFYILPGPVTVLKCLYENYQLIFSQALITFSESIFGLIIGTVFGCAVALIMIYFKRSSAYLQPLLLTTQTLPTFVIAPILVLWLGYGISAKIITTIIMIFFPITTAFYDGLRNTKQDYLDLAHTMNGQKTKIFFHVKIPYALPSLASGLRVATAIAPIGAIIGEWVGASKGLGFLMLNANERMQIDLMFACLMVIIIFSLLLYFIVDRLLNFLIPWQKK